MFTVSQLPFPLIEIWRNNPNEKHLLYWFVAFFIGDRSSFGSFEIDKLCFFNTFNRLFIILIVRVSNLERINPFLRHRSNDFFNTFPTINIQVNIEQFLFNDKRFFIR
ncbi:hypothetical protein HMPREF9161_00801 [Selenomonas sp. F0473]|nr:hypothetical protein HMPREF9161_00801 [Selenomonas sp. F0473]